MQARTVFPYLLATLISLAQPFVLSHSLIAAAQTVPHPVPVTRPAREETNNPVEPDANPSPHDTSPHDTSPQNTPPQNTPPHSLSNEEWQSILAQTNLPNTLPNTGAEVNVSWVSQQAYLKASNREAADSFGYSTDLYGDTLVIGAYNEDSAARGVNGDPNDNSAPAAGAVYVFVHTSGIWSQQAYLKASNSEAGDNFGYSVAIAGDTLIVGAWGEASAADGVNGNQDDNSASGAGAAYVFVRTNGIWSQQAYLKASNSEGADHFGSSVAIAGDTLVVGAPDEDSAARGVNGNQNDDSLDLNAGAAYVFMRTGGIWSQQAYLKASNSDGGDGFGSSVAIAGNTVVVGAAGEDSEADGVNGNQDDNSAREAGAVYAFVRTGVVTGGVWSQQAYLKAAVSRGVTFDGKGELVHGGAYFGSSVAISGDTLVIGAWGENSNAVGVNGDQFNRSAHEAGAAYVFVHSGGVFSGNWTQQAYLKASNTHQFDAFGFSVAITGDTVIVGAIGEDNGINGNGAPNSGAAYVFVRTAGGWSQLAYLKASNSDPDDNFGRSVSIAGNMLVVGAPNEASAADGVNGNQFDNSVPQAGAAYLFQISSQPPPTILYVSSTSAGSVANPNSPTNPLVTFADEDILAFNQTSQTWSKYFDGSDVGLSINDIDAFTLRGNHILFSLELSATLPNVGLVEPQDILRFVPSSLGETTRGSFEWVLDGSIVGLTSAGEDIDGIGFAPDGRLLVSTAGSYNLNTGTLTGPDEDILVFTGRWARYFDGSDVNLLDSGEDIRGISYSQGSNDLYLTTRGLFNLPGLTGDSSDILICRPATLGEITACSFSLFIDGSTIGFGTESIDGLQVNNGVQTVMVTTADADDTSVDDLNADDHAEEVEESDEEEMNSQLFLPWSAR